MNNSFIPMARADSSDDQKNVIAYSIVGDTLVLMEGSVLKYKFILNSIRIMDLKLWIIITQRRYMWKWQILEDSRQWICPATFSSERFLRIWEQLNLSISQQTKFLVKSLTIFRVCYFWITRTYLTIPLAWNIPSSTQLQSFGASAFADNDLCGAPHPNCIEKNVLVRDDENGKGNEDEDEDGIDRLLYVSMALGFVVGFWCFIGSLLINRRWRYKYCYFLLGLGDKFGCTVRKCY